MEAEDVPQATKKQVSEKVMENLRKAQAKRKEMYEQKKAQHAAEKEANKKLKRVERLKKQLVELVGQEEQQSDHHNRVTTIFK